MEEVMACSDDPQDSSTPWNLKSIIIRLSEQERPEGLTSHQLCIVKSSLAKERRRIVNGCPP